MMLWLSFLEVGGGLAEVSTSIDGGGVVLFEMGDDAVALE